MINMFFTWISTIGEPEDNFQRVESENKINKITDLVKRTFLPDKYLMPVTPITPLYKECLYPQTEAETSYRALSHSLEDSDSGSDFLNISPIALTSVMPVPEKKASVNSRGFSKKKILELVLEKVEKNVAAWKSRVAVGKNNKQRAYNNEQRAYTITLQFFNYTRTVPDCSSIKIKISTETILSLTIQFISFDRVFFPGYLLGKKLNGSNISIKASTIRSIEVIGVTYQQKQCIGTI